MHDVTALADVEADRAKLRPMLGVTRTLSSLAVIVASAWGCSGDGDSLPKGRGPDAGVDAALEIPGGTLDDAARWQARHATFEAGRVTFAGEGDGDACELGWIAQTVPLPPRAGAGALVLELDVASSCALDTALACPALQLEVADSVTRVSVRGGASQTVLKAAAGLRIHLLPRASIRNRGGMPMQLEPRV